MHATEDIQSEDKPVKFHHIICQSSFLLFISCQHLNIAITPQIAEKKHLIQK